MKKSRIKIVSHALISASLRGLAVFAIFGMALFAYAVNYPASQPNAVSGVVGLYVGKAPGGTKTGSQIGSYQNANNLCANGTGVLEDSHVCTPMEIINTYNHNASTVTSEAGTVWLNAGAPANIFPAVNDCSGWTDGGSAYYGNIWVFDSTDAAGIAPCAFSFSIACCK